MSSPRFGCRIGVLVPHTNTNLEPDLEAMRPSGASFHFTRIGGYDPDETPGESEMAGMGESDISAAVEMLSAVRPDFILYGCTSATLAHGAEFDRRLCGEIMRCAGVPAITAAGSLLTALQVLGAAKVSFVSPYTRTLTRRAAGFFEESGVKVANSQYIGTELNSREQGELSAERIVELGLRADHKETEAVVLACTDLRAVEAIAAIETTLDKPVVSSNQAMLYHVLNELGLARPAYAPGRLFDYLDA